MPRYDYRCRTCDTGFEVTRSFADPVAAVTCPAGHADTARVYTPVAVGGRTNAGAAATAGSSADPMPAPSAGGACCGGGCCG